MIFIDFHKAFDNLEWNFLFSCLEAFGFGPEFIWWVRTLYRTMSNFARKEFYLEIGQCQKTYKHLVFRRSFYLWKSNNYQVFNHTKICLHFLASAGPQGNR